MMQTIYFGSAQNFANENNSGGSSGNSQKVLNISPNKTFIGTQLTVIDNVVSGFNNSGYDSGINYRPGECWAAIPFCPGNRAWELGIKFKLNSNPSRSICLVENRLYNYSVPQIFILQNKTLTIYLSSNRSGWDIASSPAQSYPIELQTWYRAKLEYKLNPNNEQKHYVFSLAKNNSNFEEQFTVENSLPVYNTQDSYIAFGCDSEYRKQEAYLDGEIDLAHTYWRFDDQEVFRGI